MDSRKTCHCKPVVNGTKFLLYSVGIFSLTFLLSFFKSKTADSNSGSIPFITNDTPSLLKRIPVLVIVNSDLLQDSAQQVVEFELQRLKYNTLNMSQYSRFLEKRNEERMRQIDKRKLKDPSYMKEFLTGGPVYTQTLSINLKFKPNEVGNLEVVTFSVYTIPLKNQKHVEQYSFEMGDQSRFYKDVLVKLVQIINQTAN